ncbi:hypothetical protein Syun_016749 [Stephania yunnanensis]|uniref:Uncharacterized protein n=1 Tax=Stephania yunnanensis TaxID=152371 RepID=A0AAP0J803_9MAGN
MISLSPTTPLLSSLSTRIQAGGTARLASVAPKTTGSPKKLSVLLVSIKAPHHCGVYQNQNLAPAHHLLYATAPPKPSIIFVLRHCASPSAARRRISHSVSFLLASGCSSSHYLLVVTACTLSLFSVVFVCHCVSPPAARRRLRLRQLRSPSWSLYMSEDAGRFASALAPALSLAHFPHPPSHLLSLTSAPSSL